jgi:hypothetical protein
MEETTRDNASPITQAIESIKVEEQAAAAAAAATPVAPKPALVAEPLNHRKPRLIEPVPIELDKTRHLRLPFWALKMFEERTGINAWDEKIIFDWPPKLAVITTLLWVALLDEDDTLTLDQVERMPGLEFGNIYYILHCLDLCWGRNQPPADPATASATGGGGPNASAA